MSRLHQDNNHSVETFIQHVCRSQQVWVLDDRGCVAGCPSNDQKSDVFPVFSEQPLARQGAAHWNYVFPPFKVSLYDYMTFVLPFQIEHDLLAGPNWDGNMAGAEIAPDILLRRLEEALNQSQAILTAAAE